MPKYLVKAQKVRPPHWPIWAESPEFMGRVLYGEPESPVLILLRKPKPWGGMYLRISDLIKNPTEAQIKAERDKLVKWEAEGLLNWVKK